MWKDLITQIVKDVEILVDLVDLNIKGFRCRNSLFCRDPCGSRGSKSDGNVPSNIKCPVEILVDLVDLNCKKIQMPCMAIGRDPCGSRGSK